MNQHLEATTAGRSTLKTNIHEPPKCDLSQIFHVFIDFPEMITLRLNQIITMSFLKSAVLVISLANNENAESSIAL